METLLELEHLFQEVNATRTNIEYLPVDEVFDKEAMNAKYEIKKAISKCIADMIVNLSRECPESKKFRIDAKRLSKEIQKKYDLLTKDFFFSQKQLNEEISNELRVLKGKGRYNHNLKLGSSIVSPISKKKSFDFMIEAGDNDSMGIKSARDSYSSISTPSKHTFSKNSSKVESDVLLSTANPKTPFTATGLDLGGLEPPLDVSKLTFKVDQYESGIECGILI